MKRSRRLYFLICGLGGVLALSACASPGDRYGDPVGGSPVNAGTVLSDVDWSTAESVTIRLSEFEFTPETAVFTAGRPYKLVLESDGKSGHTFTAAKFFQAIALRALEPATGAPAPGVLESVAVEAGKTRTLRFVPVIAGTYGLTCERPLHEVFGMHGTIRIE